MSKRVRHIRTPGRMWPGSAMSQSWWLNEGVRIIEIGGDVVTDPGLELEQVGLWFDHARPIPSDLTHRLFCHCGNGPVGLVWRVWQDGGRSLVRVTYLQRQALATTPMRELKAYLHSAEPGCRHGWLVAHPEDTFAMHCPAGHAVDVPGDAIMHLIRQVGQRGGEHPPTPRRVTLPRPS